MSAQAATSEARSIFFDFSGVASRHVDLLMGGGPSVRRLDIATQPATATPLFIADVGIPSRARDSWLAEALTELAEADLEAKEEGYPAPGDVAKTQAKRILRQLSITDPAGSSPAITPTADGDIAISFHNPEIEGIVEILCEQGGSAAVYSTIAGKSRYTRYDAASAIDLPDAILRSELARLRPA